MFFNKTLKTLCFIIITYLVIEYNNELLLKLFVFMSLKLIITLKSKKAFIAVIK